MKITYDASLLGLGHYGAKTGLFRVASNLIAELLDASIKEDPASEISLCTSLSFDILMSTCEYLANDQHLQTAKFIGEEHGQGWRKSIYKLALAASNPACRLGYFNERKLPHTVLKLLNYRFKALTSSDLASQDIYHSIYHGIPRAAKAYRQMARFITVHDLIPILHPELFGVGIEFEEFDENFDLKKILDGLDFDTWVICVSQSTKDDLCNYLGKRIDPDKIHVIYPGVSNHLRPCHDPKQILSVKQKYGIPNQPYILSLGTLEPRKNFAHTIECFKSLIRSEKIDDLNLVITGTRSWNEPILAKAIAQNASLKDRIILTGFVDDMDLSALYSGALVFVYPSLYEGFGLPPLEAMQCGTPVITSNNSSLPEVVGDAGIMVEARDPDAFCQAILDIYLHPHIRKNLAKKGLARSQQFSWSKCAQSTMAAYKQSLQNLTT